MPANIHKSGTNFTMNSALNFASEIHEAGRLLRFVDVWVIRASLVQQGS